MTSAFGCAPTLALTLPGNGSYPRGVTEFVLEMTQQKITRRAEEAVSRSIGGRICPKIVREWEYTVSSVGVRGSSSAGNEGRFSGRLGGGGATGEEQSW